MDARPRMVVDLGCGNAALTFAAHRYLTSVRGLDVQLVGVDAKPQARARNRALAATMACDYVTFVAGTIATSDLPRADIVLALHACDTGTDEALAWAVAWHAHLLLASPCCHQDLQRQLVGRPPPDLYGLVARHGILRERLDDLLTDARRAALLADAGYSCEVAEFTDAALTSCNTLLRAVTSRPGVVAAAASYDRLIGAWGVRPRLQKPLRAAPVAADAGVPEAAGATAGVEVKA